MVIGWICGNRRTSTAAWAMHTALATAAAYASVNVNHQGGAYNTPTLIGALGGATPGAWRAEGDLAVGRAARPPQPGHGRLAASSAVLAGGGAAACVRAELNPVEALWADLKGVELAGDTLQELTAAAERGIQRIRSTHHLAFSFLPYGDLSLWVSSNVTGPAHLFRTSGLSFVTFTSAMQRTRKLPIGSGAIAAARTMAARWCRSG
jgi:hypothetical protein